MKDIIDAIESSQHCQRNWDLSKQIDPKHMNIFESVVKTVPSKQNIAYYKVHFISDRSVIEEIYKWTMTETPNDLDEDFYNPQVLANLLVIYEDYWDISKDDRGSRIKERNISNIEYNGYTIHVDRQQAIGISAGILAFTANYLGYKTGFCRCFKQKEVSEILKVENSLQLMIGIGFPKQNISHTIHHITNSDSLKPMIKSEIPIIKLP